MRASRVKRFFRDQHFFSSYVSRLTRAQVCIDGTAGCFAWPRSRGQPPKPGGSRRKARGVDGESARRATIVAGHYAANVTDLPLILFPPFRLRLFNRSKAEPSSLCSNSAASTYIRSESSPYQGPPCIVARAKGSKGDGTILRGGVFQPCQIAITHPPWIRSVPFVRVQASVLKCFKSSKLHLSEPIRSPGSATVRSAACVRLRRS